MPRCSRPGPAPAACDLVGGSRHRRVHGTDQRADCPDASVPWVGRRRLRRCGAAVRRRPRWGRSGAPQRQASAGTTRTPAGRSRSRLERSRRPEFTRAAGPREAGRRHPVRVASVVYTVASRLTVVAGDGAGDGGELISRLGMDALAVLRATVGGRSGARECLPTVKGALSRFLSAASGCRGPRYEDAPRCPSPVRAPWGQPRPPARDGAAVRSCTGHRFACRAACS